LARELYSGHVRRNGKIEVNAFLASARNQFGISVNRWSKAPERLFKTLGFDAASRRKNQNFKGFGCFQTQALAQILVDGSLPVRVIGAPTRRNPLHGDIPLPPARAEDYYLLIATEFIRKTKPLYRPV